MPLQEKQLKGAIIPNALSYTLKLGEALRKAKENGEDVVQKVVEAGEGKILFRGIVKRMEGRGNWRLYLR